MNIVDLANYGAIASAIGFAYFLGRRIALAEVARALNGKRGELPGVEPGWYPSTPAKRGDVFEIHVGTPHIGSGSTEEDFRVFMGKVLDATANEAPTTKRAIPGEQPATTWEEDAS